MSLQEEISLVSGGHLSVEKKVTAKQVALTLDREAQGECVLHWGLSRNGLWELPPKESWPTGTKQQGDRAVQSPFPPEGTITISLDKDTDCPSIAFVLFYPKEGKWDNSKGHDYFISLPGHEPPAGLAAVSAMADGIIRAEMGKNSWTLMHRFNLCHDLLERVQGDREGLALLYVWLRFSALRQLDWQRNYNTKPRELSHAMDRLTLRMAETYSSQPSARDLIRLMIATLGRGGEGQRIRDEILNIMHRHHIKEVSGHFMEEWHQKLHNNTTPDDIVICEAYLAFLRSNGDRGHFYWSLEQGGVTKERLAGFERPIVTPPDFVPHIKDGLIHDFENFLRLLKSVHSATDLESSYQSGNYLLNGGMHDLMGFILNNRDNGQIPVDFLCWRVTEARRLLNDFLRNERDRGRVRDGLFMDLALEEFLRTLVERNIHNDLLMSQLVELISLTMENILFSLEAPGLRECLAHWRRLKELSPVDQDWYLHAKSVLDRIRMSINGFTDSSYALFQSKAEYLGKAFRADPWTVTIFTEEAVRGRLPFGLSMLLHHLDPLLRKGARLGDWQVISPAAASGRLEVVESLLSLQGQRFDTPTVIIAQKVRGDEEPPEGATAIITPDATDIVSHVAIRARNSHLLFATCFDDAHLEKLASLKGRSVNLMVTTAGDVLYEEASAARPAPPIIRKEISPVRDVSGSPAFTAYAIVEKAFREGAVGGKSLNLKRLRERLPGGMRVPVSVAIPFGVFEQVLSLEMNRGVRQRYRELLQGLDKAPALLPEIREVIMELAPPEEMVAGLRTVMAQSGLPFPADWDRAWECVKRVWASKWNERAYFSRRAWGISHDDLLMAVLIQEVVAAEYAFVLHTMNPMTRDKGELYGELVPGLGETLVGNYPGRALGFSFRKETGEIRIISYPSKDKGLFGGGLIFRSDSNGEDLVDYSGAGLYDSVMMETPREVSLDYTNEPLIWDSSFRDRLLSQISKTGLSIEDAFGSPQD
ncbi:MAG: PEP/pyruvate-binding domain-containing protein, partial [Thermodesulfovibrionales bacterium]